MMIGPITSRIASDITSDRAVSPLDLRDAAQVAEADAYVRAHPASTPFHRTGWIAAVEQATGNRAHMLVARGADGLIAGLLPLVHMRSRLFGNALVSAAFAVDGGILADDEAVAGMLAGAAEALAATLGGLPMELRGGIAPGAGWRMSEGAHLGFVRPLAADDEAELLAIPRKHRAELRKALANEALHYETGTSERLIRDHYRVYAQSVRNLGTPVFPRALFRRMLAQFGPDADILVIYEGDRPVSAVLSFYHHGAVMPYWGGGIADARRLRSNELLYFRLMGHARVRGCTIFDFGRSKANSGQASWKKSWGFEPRPLAYHVREHGPVRDINPTSDRYGRKVELWKKLPLPVANAIGPWLARGLG
ncbi:FemAB family XrtA/PEP-CTERM system-associated protein [Sphingobium aquiterrae]|uniref:FemAB family XrtA/PEP-CTERM system-associated protein n=1 Tax=Sphingobium aquiterrae TaxID=2038656 RepID=UPI003015B373